MNLAATYRGGERQTELLIRAHAEAGLHQLALVRHGGALHERLADVAGLETRAIRKPFMARLRAFRGCTLIHAHETRAAQLAMIANLAGGYPYLITRRVFNRPKTNPFTTRVYRRAECVVPISRAIHKVMSDAYPGLRQIRIPSMAAGFNPSIEKVAEIRRHYHGEILVVHVGALVKRSKGQHLIIEAASRMLECNPSFRFLLLGDGPDEAELMHQARGLKNVDFLGFRPEVAEYIAAADIFVFPSLLEGLGSTLLDAMEAGRPIVASNVGGIPDIVEQRKNGLLVEPGDVDGIIESLRLLAKDKSLRANLGKAGQRMAMEYQPEKIGARYRELYCLLIERQTCE